MCDSPTDLADMGDGRNNGPPPTVTITWVVKLGWGGGGVGICRGNLREDGDAPPLAN
jgi:hypothetical protein